MALFDFLKKKEKKEKIEQKKESAEVVAPKKDDSDPKQEKEKPQIAVIGESVLHAPHVTERARSLSDLGRYTFRVGKQASKRDVKNAVEKMYGVHVDAVNIVKVHEKKRRRGLTEGTKKGYKKAVVALRSGEAIDIY